MEIIPSPLKEEIIIPIYKGEKESGRNCRLVTLRSHVIKICEGVVKNAQHPEQENNIKPGQDGTRKDKSCLSQILNHCEHTPRDVTENKDDVQVSKKSPMELYSVS